MAVRVFSCATAQDTIRLQDQTVAAALDADTIVFRATLERVVAERDGALAALAARTKSERKWLPINTAPRDGKRPLYLAQLDENGEVLELDFGGTWEEPGEDSGYGGESGYAAWGWCSAFSRAEEPTHWAYQDGPPPAEMKQREKALEEAGEKLARIGEFCGCIPPPKSAAKCECGGLAALDRWRALVPPKEGR